MSNDNSDLPWISVQKDSSRLTFSKPLADQLGAEDGHRVVLAFTDRDGEYQPWIGAVPEDESSVAPQVEIQEHEDESVTRKIEAGALADELDAYAKEEERTRLLLSSETKVVDHPHTKGQVTMHRLDPPEGSEQEA